MIYNTSYNMALGKLKNHSLFEPSVQSIIGGRRDKARCLCGCVQGAFSNLLGTRQHLGRTRSAHHTHTRDVPLPYPLQRQAFGGVLGRIEASSLRGGAEA